LKKLIALLIFVGIGVLTLMLAHCGTRITSNYTAANAPGLVHVTNGTTLGFYKPTGGYGFATQAKSIISFGGAYGGTQPFAQNTTTGAFYFGTNNVNLGNAVFYLNANLGGFAFATLAGSEIILQSVGTTTTVGTSQGVAFSPTNNLVYVTDPYNTVVTYLNSAKPAYGIGGNMGNSVFAAPTGLGASYIGVGKNTVVVSETQVGSVYFMNANNGDPIIAVGNKTSLPLVNASTPCNASNLVNQVQVSTNGGQAFILCGPSVVYINLLVSAPNYFLSGSLLTSTAATTGITTPRDFVYDSGDNTVIVVGGTKVISLDAQTGALVNSLDVSIYNCGSGISLAGVAYSSVTNQIYVTDSVNSQVYVLGSSSFGLPSGECATSVFSTATDVPGPTKIGYY
jgi:hypothetical protein